MKAFKFGDNVAIIGGKRVPYSLLGALAAILGAVLIWMQFKNSGGINLGQQSPDLSSLLDSGGGASGLGSAFPDLSGMTPQSYVPGSQVYIPSYSSPFTPTSSTPSTPKAVLPKIDLTSVSSPIGHGGPNAPGFQDRPQYGSNPPPQITADQRAALSAIPLIGAIFSPPAAVPVSITNRAGGNKAVA